MESRKARFRILPDGSGFAVETDGQKGEIAYVSKEAAFEALVAKADVALAEGLEIEILIPGGPGRFA
jgi:hypothetical protein